MKKPILLLILVFFTGLNSLYSQKEYMDYIITEKNDTIYGFLNSGFYERNPHFKGSGLKYKHHSLSKVKQARHNLEVFYSTKYDKELKAQKKSKSDSIIVFQSIGLNNFIRTEKRLPDYVVTPKNDTIYGRIPEGFSGSRKNYIIDENNNKIKINREDVMSLRFENKIYRNFFRANFKVNDNEKDFLQLVSDGKVQLYSYTISGMSGGGVSSGGVPTGGSAYGGDTFYIVKDNELIRMTGSKKSIKKHFSDYPDLIALFDNTEYEELFQTETATLKKFIKILNDRYKN